MSKTTAGIYRPMGIQVQQEFEGFSYSTSFLTGAYALSYYSNCKTAIVNFPNSPRVEKIVCENKPGYTLVSKYDNAIYFYVFPEELHILKYNKDFTHQVVKFKNDSQTINGTSLVMEDELYIYLISTSKIVTIEKKNPTEVKNTCPLDNSFSSFAKESCVLPNNRILLADSVVNMGNVHFKVWDLIAKKVVAQLYRVPGENEPSCYQVFHNEIYMAMGTCVYYCTIPTKLNPDNIVVLEFSKYEFHDRSIQSFLVEDDYVFIGDSYGMVTLHSFPSFEYLHSLALGVERDEQVKFFDERPVFSFRNSVVGMKRVLKYLVYWLLNGTVCISNFFATERQVDCLSFGDNKRQLREIYFTFNEKLNISMRFNVLKEQNSAIIPLNEFYTWEVQMPSRISPELAYVGFFQMFPTIIKGIYSALDNGSKNTEKLKNVVKECYFIVTTINSIKEHTGALIPFQFFIEMVEGISEAHAFCDDSSKKSQEEIIDILNKSINDLIVGIDDSVAIAQHKIDMVKDPKFIDPGQPSSFAIKATHYNQSMRKHFMEDLLNPNYVIDENDHRVKFFYMNSSCFLIQKQNDFHKHMNQFTEFCQSNDVGALVDAQELVKINALLDQIHDEIQETRDDIKDIVSTTYASDKWLHELDFINEQLPLI
ncbi:hypothetical protein ENUP19_0004G0029 [Entamoeba nuttalli]|uniref:Uncharacterized protein n=2 Tax=Entamoeba nuttalli TaxID=412467 RepID=K2H3A7_ENTNP|nr:hypothetical protein ENU1_214670 [Entamoeba nuttalli P19]EKE36919.1 hypothetical protein ENU1_214670 [Entamoeba nuttalli P19]|eukprot:XP_008860752.1 hypothetical protein ENU1_214670 [Entamoeba nuttalli P19]